MHLPTRITGSPSRPPLARYLRASWYADVLLIRRSTAASTTVYNNGCSSPWFGVPNRDAGRESSPSNMEAGRRLGLTDATAPSGTRMLRASHDESPREEPIEPLWATVMDS
jgi:hypothetical protein